MPDNVILMVKCLGLILGIPVPFVLGVYLYARSRWKLRASDETDAAGAPVGDLRILREVTK